MTDDIDPYLRALMAIGAELTQIRVELQRANGTLPDRAGDDADDQEGDDEPTIRCRCGATFTAVGAAEAHARDEHGAPKGAEADILTTDP